MFSQFLIKQFIKNHENVEDSKVRDSYGYLGGIVGITVNIILFIVKLSVGLIVKSIAVTADAFNNLSDAFSSIITIAGFKLASKPADAEHPFGHGRIEYISGLIVSFMVIIVGLQFIKSSYNRIVNPEIINFELIPFVLILISIFAKIWLSRFNKFIGVKINSSALQASSLDALGDVITSSTVALSLLLSNWIIFPIDGYIGVLVSLFILYSGFNLIKETINPLLGEAPDPELVEEIQKEVLKYNIITGVHDLVIHNYGPGRRMASLHAEVPYNLSIMKIHDVIDKAEKEISQKLNIFLVIHMDPVNIDDDEINKAKEEVADILKNFPEVKSYHDFRIVGEGEDKSLLFDVVIDKANPLNSSEARTNFINKTKSEIKKIHPNYNVIITIDIDFS
ncbi:ferrous-iron efflux pump FieF [Clostridium homopropionicum DSM 5847]|uniref:Ferrous-iron efflux pump FieF n=1 Tax=Clostridium homopropionicum DSM 5847 TaxID=1121318 RepID=A0A0L6ZAG7_9CLOT|nr:cation diffusion facilitator family transporter [Clostridium homopropionicum]KOA19971.1 ferrous-iron efflux pump FieF [Clostridium homopropionicum DSM 5847]SFG63614.1 cation diffusion facilitator family transporter [Clostridium homopropionicum]